MKLRPYILLFIVYYFPSLSYAQSDRIDFQTWTDINISIPIKNNFHVGGDLGVRGLISETDWNQFYVRPSVRFYFTQAFNLGLGLAYFGTTSDVIENVDEVRFFQDFKLNWPRIDWVVFSSRLRFEERIFNYPNADIDQEIKYRMRYALGLETIDLRIFSEQKLYLKLNWEFFANLNQASVEQFVNNTRGLFGAGHRFNSNFHYELQYIFQKSKLLNQDELKTTEHILRLRLFWVGLSKKITAN